MSFLIPLLLGLLAVCQIAEARPLVESHLDLIRSFESRQRDRWLSLDADSSHSYDMISLSLDYRVESQAVPMTGWETLTLVGRESQPQILLNAEGVQVLHVNEYDAALPYVVVNDTLYVTRALADGDTVTLDIEVSAPVIPGPYDLGYHVADGHVYTFSEPFGARRWYPCWDQPFDKLNHITIAVNMPDAWWLASNGELTETTYPEPGRKRQVYHHDDPISTYLVMLCAGDYARQIETVGGVEYRYFTMRADSADAAYDWERTPLMVAEFAEHFGDYPFDQYGMVQADIMNGWGAMEHQTFTTWGRHLVDGTRRFESVVAHELAHMWFGDALSPVDFRNIWLNEGFATYLSALFYDFVDEEDIFNNLMAQFAQQYYSEDSQFRYAVYDPPPEYMFGSVEYEKAGWILHMLREQLLGDSLFFAAMHDYKETFQYGLVNTEDFIAKVNEAAGEDLHWFFDQWIYQAGHPVIYIDIRPRTPNPEDVTVRIAQVQTNAPIFRFPLLIDVRTSEGTVTRQFWFNHQVDSSVEHFSTNVLSASLNANQPLLFIISPSPAVEQPAMVKEFELGSVYPNPFNSAARVPFTLQSPAQVRLQAFDLLGRCVGTLCEGRLSAGTHEAVFLPDPVVASGIYWICLEANGSRMLTKAVLLK
jgi:aminopeptidase N